MKKLSETFLQCSFYFLVACCILTALTSQSPSPKELTVKLSLPEWNAVMETINKSEAPYTQVVAIQNLIIPQLQKQLADTTKKK